MDFAQKHEKSKSQGGTLLEQNMQKKTLEANKIQKMQKLKLDDYHALLKNQKKQRKEKQEK